jgi:hypothetical protein
MKGGGVVGGRRGGMRNDLDDASVDDDHIVQRIRESIEA